jgi:hypothetical protein
MKITGRRTRPALLPAASRNTPATAPWTPLKGSRSGQAGSPRRPHPSTFWFLVVGITLQQFVCTGVVRQIVPHLQQVGFNRASATAVLVLLAFV